MIMKKANLIAAALLVCMLSGCGSDAQTPVTSGVDDTTSKQEDTTTAEATSTKKIDEPEVMTGDYGGREFNILYLTNNSYRAHELYFFASAEDTGDVLNNAIYERNSAVEDALNIKIKGLPVDFDEIYNELRKVASAGDPVYDLALTHTFSYMTNMLSDRLFYDWNLIPNVDLTKNYWNQNMNETLAVNGVLPIAKSDYMPPEVYVITFNKKIHDEYGLDDYYELVREGKWTLDRFIEEVNKVSQDLNGDGVFDAKDKYGLSMPTDIGQAFLNACDMYSVGMDSDGFKINQPSERFVSMIEKLNRLYYGSDSTYLYTYSDMGTDKELKFSKGNSLFSLEDLNDIVLLRNMDDDFGLLPFPKYDEAQENYQSMNLSGYIAVPVSAGDIDLTGKAVELLNYESAKTFMPVFYDTLLGNKYIRDDESSEMLDIMFDGIVFDYGWVYGGYNEISQGVRIMLEQKTTDAMSYYEKNTKKCQKIYDKMYAIMETYNER